MKVAEQREVKRVLTEYVLPSLKNPAITDEDMVFMYGKTKLEVAITYLEMFERKLG